MAGRTARLLAIMQMVGLFDRPASGDCLEALCAEPAIPGLTDRLVADEDAGVWRRTLDAATRFARGVGVGAVIPGWRRALARLREVRLLLPADPAAPAALDAHPLVREWFGERLRQANEAAWKAAHGRLYEHLRDTTKEGEAPTLSDLAPLYQAIAHGCRAGRSSGGARRCLSEPHLPAGGGWRLEFYASKKLGAFGSNLAAISWFFVTPFEVPVAGLREADRAWVLSEAAFRCATQGRIAEALPAMRAGLRMYVDGVDWRNAAITASSLSESELLVGDVAGAVADAQHGPSTTPTVQRR